MPENNRFQKVFIKNQFVPMSSESWQKVQKEYQIVKKKNITSLLKCWLDKQEVTTGLFTFFFH